MAKHHGGKKNNQQHRRAEIGRDALIRMNFMYQAASLYAAVAAVPGTNTPSRATGSLARFYSRCMKQVASRMVLRMDPAVKRSICKQCDSILIPGLTAAVEIAGTTRRIIN
ncbi:Ribonuclease P protein subunit p21 [Podochytrium sp. JEL0797]|nr:Ribonuclease P protein subunit p21 [Podochytrium sp. JEL0797]